MTKQKKTPWNVLLQEERGEMSGVGENPFDADNQRRNNAQVEDNRAPMRDDERHRDMVHDVGDNRERLMRLNRSSMEDVLYLHPNDHTGIQLVGVQLNCKNFYSWSRSIRRALGARNKLDFINGSLLEPPSDSPYYASWLKADYMVNTWIINSISKELAHAFQYIEDSKSLWDEIKQRFDRSNGPKIYSIRRELSSYAQGNQSVTVYFNNLNGFWDELNLLLPHPVCTCGAATVFRRLNDGEKLMQFLLGLNDNFDTVRSQILLLDPLPTVSKAYSMVLQDEDQRLATSIHTHHVDESAMYARRDNNSGKGGGYKPRLSKEEKRRLKCVHCGATGHEIQDCFKLHGFPDWFKKLKDQKGKEQVHNAVQKIEDNNINPFSTLGYSTMDVSKLIQAEVARCLVQYKPTISGVDESNNVNLVQSTGDPFSNYEEHFAFTIVNDISNNDWILDSGASTHICCNAKLMKTVQKLNIPQRIYLPDGSVQWVKFIGTACLNNEIELQKVLLAPTFTHNLVFVAQLALDNAVKCTFLATHCLIQNKQDDHILGIGRSLGKLYIMSSSKNSQIHNVSQHEALTGEDWHIFSTTFKCGMCGRLLF